MFISSVCCRLRLSLELITEKFLDLLLCFFRRRCLDSELTQLHIHSHSTAARCPSLIYCVITTIVINMCAAYACERKRQREQEKLFLKIYHSVCLFYLCSLLRYARRRPFALDVPNRKNAFNIGFSTSVCMDYDVCKQCKHKFGEQSTERRTYSMPSLAFAFNWNYDSMKCTLNNLIRLTFVSNYSN